VFLWERYAGLLAFALLALQFVVYPQVVYALARRARHQKKAELNAQYLDALMLGVWTARNRYFGGRKRIFVFLIGKGWCTDDPAGRIYGAGDFFLY
jgi:hypothetical protein